MPTTRRRPSLYPDKEISLEGKRKTITSSEGSSFIRKESLQHLLEESPPNTKDTRRYLAKKSRRGYLNTPFGIMPLNYSQEPLPHYPDDSSPLPRVKLPKHRSL